MTTRAPSRSRSGASGPISGGRGRARVPASPLRREARADGRIGFRGRVPRPGEDRPRILRLVTVEDGETVPEVFRPPARGERAMKLDFDTDRASRHLDPGTLETVASPLRPTEAA